MKILDLIVAVFASVLLTGMIFCLVIRYPCNHAGSAYVFLPAFSAGLLYSLSRIRKCRILIKVGIIVSVVGCLLVIACDVFNLWISYEKWIDRGMPEFGAVIRQNV